MTDKDVKEQLNLYRKAVRDAEAALIDIRTLEERSTAIGSMNVKPDRIKSSMPLSARFEDVIIDKVDLEAIVDEEIQRLQDIRSSVQQLISYASTVRGRIVLTEYYINGCTEQTIAKQMHYDISTIQRIKRRAIKQIAVVVR